MHQVSQDSRATRPEDSPIAWFGELLMAIDRGDYRHASVAQSQLIRLGWRVSRKRNRPSTHPTGQCRGRGR
jgi:hypothetical protein